MLFRSLSVRIDTFVAEPLPNSFGAFPSHRGDVGRRPPVHDGHRRVLQNYAAVRATFVHEVTQVSQEFSAFHPNPQQPTFTPTNAAAMKAAFGPLVKAGGAACFCSTNYPETLFKAVNGSRVLADSDNWFAAGVKGLVKIPKELPTTLRL